MHPHLVIDAIDLPWPDAGALLEHWAPDRPLALLHSGRTDDRWARWSIAAEPRGAVTLYADRHVIEGAVPTNLAALLSEESSLRRRLDAIADAATLRAPAPSTSLPFRTGWVIVLHYELGAALEPAATERATDPDQPLATLLWCPDALVHDRVEQQWWRVRRSDAPAAELPITATPITPSGPRVGVIEDAWPPDAYLAAVATARSHIEAGDIFQANITRPLRCAYEGSGRALAQVALEQARPWYGASVELPGGRHVISLSPELFLSCDDERWLTTRPIKGTRPASADPGELEQSSKDAAELHMIVDLMRNDLGRVSEFGTVEVRRGRHIESHPTVHHGVAEIVGRRRAEITWSDVLAATFPPGSITGAPKIKAMRIIERLESGPRGPYCGAMGFLSSHGAFTLNVGIRTLDLADGMITYGTGGGIVADSDPVDEFRETVTKAEVFRSALDALTPRGVPTDAAFDQRC